LWEFIKSNYTELLARYGDGGFLLGRIIKTLAAFHDAALGADIQKFFTTHPKPGADRTVLQVLEHISAASAWSVRDKDVVAKFVSKFSA
jgi:tricorn protease interacting factor F2/3